MIQQLTVPRFFTETRSPNLVGRIANIVDGWCYYELYKSGALIDKCSTDMDNILRNIKLGNLVWQLPKGELNAS